MSFTIPVYSPDEAFVDNGEYANYWQRSPEPRQYLRNRTSFGDVVRSSWAVLLYIFRFFWATWKYLHVPVYWMLKRMIRPPLSENDRRTYPIVSIFWLSFEVLRFTHRADAQKTDHMTAYFAEHHFHVIALFVVNLLLFYIWLTLVVLNAHIWKDTWKAISPIIWFVWEISKWGHLQPSEIDRVKDMLHTE